MILQQRRRAPGDSDKLGVVFKLLPWKAALFSLGFCRDAR